MISLELAMELKKAGLRWQPELHDFFGIPERGMDGRRFVISDMLANIEQVLGAPVVAFQGASEWALDYLVTSEAVWLPREEQLRQRLQAHLEASGEAEIRLRLAPGLCQLELRSSGVTRQVAEADAETAYARALLLILKENPPAGEEPANPWERGLQGE
jgi:hypothetical protein